MTTQTSTPRTAACFFRAALGLDGICARRAMLASHMVRFFGAPRCHTWPAGSGRATLVARENADRGQNEGDGANLVPRCTEEGPACCVECGPCDLRLTDRLQYVEQMLGDSATKHAQDGAFNACCQERACLELLNPWKPKVCSPKMPHECRVAGAGRRQVKAG